ncbi:MAG: CDP-alcohol phosphatidyltransferase family protein, partial [Holophagales bacterium]|nr:CDP-alcohol phosphatidyltransferase family protein [Holophagales bacterium]
MELRPWTLPNLLTFARLVALPFLIIAIVEGEQMQAFAIFFAMAVSDFVDGYLARHFGMASPLGALLDPIADKLLLVSTFIVFALKSTPTNIHIPLWLVLMTVGRDVLIVAAALVMALRPRNQVVSPHLSRQGEHVRRDLDGRGDPDEQRRPDAGVGRGRLLPRDGAP